MRKSKLLRRISLSLILSVPAYLFIVLAHGWYTDWQPEQEAVLPIGNQAQSPILRDSVVSFITWNVGFGGLGAESDFFYDDEGMWYSGSSMVRSPKSSVEKNLRGALDFLRQTKADFFLLQEVDVRSNRSYQLLQYQEYCRALPGFAATMAVNYRCDRVPIPLLEPWNAYGAVESGLGTFCRYQPSEAIRYQLPGHYPMPDRMFQLDRCAALHRIPTVQGKDLVVINIHNSAYDPGDKIKAIQLPYLRDLAIDEFEKGNYVVIGGDWNQCPPFFRFDSFMPGKTQGYVQGNIPDGFFPEDWHFAYDPATPTNRKCRDPYQKGKTFETLIDYFLVSPNVRINSVKGIGQDFQFSDHQPVWMEVLLR